MPGGKRAQGGSPSETSSRTAVLSGTLAGHQLPVSRPGVEPGPRPSESRMQSATPSGQMIVSEPTTGFAPVWAALSSKPLARPEPFSVEPRRQFCCSARARGVEPRTTVLEAVCSPRSTPVWGWLRPCQRHGYASGVTFQCASLTKFDPDCNTHAMRGVQRLSGRTNSGDY